MFEWFYTWTNSQIIKAIDEIDEKRKKKRMSGKTMNSSFADDLKNYIMGVDIKDVVPVKPPF